MVSRSNLKVVESVPFQRREVALWTDDGNADAHSLHDAVQIPGAFRPELPRHFIERYSPKGGIVLDPFCGSGVTSLEANLLGRVAYGSDLDPLGLRIAEGKVYPADITEVTLRLQLANLRRPIALTAFSDSFRQFFDLDTFREIVNLRNFVNQNPDRITRFVELVALGLLHGHTAGYFSVYSFPQISLRPDQQRELNIKRGQSPDYRSVVPRILRKTASILRDGYSSSNRSLASRNRFSLADARNLAYVPSSSIDLTVTAPPLPTSLVSQPSDQWLRHWFLGMQPDYDAPSFGDSLDEWRDCMNEALLELARVSRPGARAVFDLREVKEGRETIYLDDLLMGDVQENLGRYWDVEAVLVHQPKAARIRHKERDIEKSSRSSRILMLRRR